MICKLCGRKREPKRFKHFFIKGTLVKACEYCYLDYRESLKKKPDKDDDIL